MKPLDLFDALAVPLYDAFDSDAATTASRTTAIAPNVDLTERNPDTPGNASSRSRLPLTPPDRVPQRVLDRSVWHVVHGAGSQPPPPGPERRAARTRRSSRGGGWAEGR